MSKIVFIDTEINPRSKKILDLGGVDSNGNQFHKNSIKDFTGFINGADYLCGHNIIDHDLPFLEKALQRDFSDIPVIDTLYLSPLLFPKKPYHKLLKDDKLQTGDINNPLSDAKKAKDLFYDEQAAFNKLNQNFKAINYLLLNGNIHFTSFFKYVNYAVGNTSLKNLILDEFDSQICSNVDLDFIIQNDPEALAYSLALIGTRSRESITPLWVFHRFPAVERVMFQLRSRPCLQGCPYCNESFDAKVGLKYFFNFDSYRTFNGEPLQEKAVQAALNNKSILTIFPTGGGKSLTYQIPALMAGENAHALTIIISPLQSLMKDQVDNLEKKGITEAVTINGLLDPIERGKAVERVDDGTASILYISPELLRSKTIERLFLGRKIARFVIDEAHCFSAWGHDFRVDYMYIGEFIKNLQRKKNLTENLPISCFTATAKPQVIEDIRSYFKEKLNIDLELFKTTATRENLRYNVINCANNQDKFYRLRGLINEKQCPTIVYVSRTRRAELVAKKLTEDGCNARAYHGRMDVKEKTANQNAFMSGEADVIVATSAFGMGVDKDNVGMVVHYDISDSLENYVQESGRAGRDDSISAECYILYNEDDLGKHFILLNQTKIDRNQIQDVWKAIKGLTKFRSEMSRSALEIARRAGWNEQIYDLEVRVTTAISALEEAGYVKRTHNSPQIFADSILSHNAEEAILKIKQSPRFSEKQKGHAIRIIRRLISAKNIARSIDNEAESRVDYISDLLGIHYRDVIKAVTLMREEKILGDTKDLSAFINHSESQRNSKRLHGEYAKLENHLIEVIQETESIINYKELNEQALGSGIKSSVLKIKTVINFWSIKNWIKRNTHRESRDNFTLDLKVAKDKLIKHIEKRHVLSEFIIEYLYSRPATNEKEDDDRLIQFSVHELKAAYESRKGMFDFKVSIYDVEEALFFLSRIEALRIEGGFLVIYNKMNINRLEDNLRLQYKQEDYDSLKRHYEHKTQQIHIVGEYAKKMLSDYRGALTFVNDYFQLNFSSFINKYFPGSRKDEIIKSITPAQFKKLFGELSTRQLDIIKDNETQYVVVAAGPGSGKTRLLVHKLASIIYMEDVKYEQLIMLTFSRAAVNEFKERLMDLIGNAALFVEIRTFHSFCFDLVGRLGSIEKSGDVIENALELLRNNEVEPGRIAKVVMVIDEAQDIDEDEFALVQELMRRNPEMRIIAVGDDDQNIYEFRGSDSKYFQSLLEHENSRKYELVENYRSKNNLVEFTNQFARCIENRIKETEIKADDTSDGNIRIIKYNSDQLIEPVVNDILKAELSGSTSVLTQTNLEALHISGNLNRKGLKAKLIQTNSGFYLHNLKELRYAIDYLNSDPEAMTINEEQINSCKRKLKERFPKNHVLPVCLKVLDDFMRLYPKTKYKTDLKVFIGESNYEDFISLGQDTIMVSTIHKAKGKEFDNVFLLLNNFDLSTEDKRRQLYVALTRAKSNLTIHYNGSFLDNIEVENIKRINDRGNYNPPEKIYMHLTHRDINLGYSVFVQHRIKRMQTGDRLALAEDGCNNEKGEQVLKFSKSFLDKIHDLEQKGFRPSSARVNFIVYWYNEEKKEEVQIILPEVVFERGG
ncbi:MAG: RecQ family ATP-dependent DNA helicase [Bacteroidales bacterium]|nr:RecQ family ATP-dependent DNA helicase [Bacteroidales bacterium]